MNGLTPPDGVSMDEEVVEAYAARLARIGEDVARGFAYNVDAALDPKPEHPGGMPFNGDLDLLRHRCRTLVDDDEEQRPYESHHTEPLPRPGAC